MGRYSNVESVKRGVGNIKTESTDEGIFTTMAEVME
jgi:hypothetical protein